MVAWYWHGPSSHCTLHRITLHHHMLFLGTRGGGHRGTGARRHSLRGSAPSTLAVVHGAVQCTMVYGAVHHGAVR